MKILFLGRALLPSKHSLDVLTPEVYRYIEDAKTNPNAKHPIDMIVPSIPYSGRRYFSLAFALGKIADVKFYGPGFPDYEESWRPGLGEIDVEKVIERLYPNDYPDVVIQLSPCNVEGLFGSWSNFDKVKCLRVMWAADFHNDVSHPGVPEMMKKGHWHIIVKSWDVRNLTEYSRLVQRCEVQMEWLPFSIDPEVFKDYQLPKIYDVINLGTFAGCYPLRLKIHEILNPMREEIKYMYYKDFLKSKEYTDRGLMTDEYAEIMNKSKIFATCTSSFKYPSMKLLEIMACNTLLVCDKPYDAEELGLEAGVNYVEIGTDIWPDQHGTKPIKVDEFMNLINFYLENPDEASRIARNGYELAYSKHTNQIRAEQFLEILSKHLR